jgi:hypothetical protein
MCGTNRPSNVFATPTRSSVIICAAQPLDVYVGEFEHLPHGLGQPPGETGFVGWSTLCRAD